MRKVFFTGLTFVLLVIIGFTVFAEEKGAIRLGNRGVDTFVDYSKYGKFKNVGTHAYKYIIDDMDGLKNAVGTGIYPNKDVYNDDAYVELVENKEIIKDSIWSHINSGDSEADFYAWATIPVVSKNYPDHDPGTRLFFTAEALKAAGEVLHAIKAYYALAVHFPQTACWGADTSFVWYAGPAAIERIEVLCRENPELGFKLVGANIKIENGKDTDLDNDIVTVNPGRFVMTSEGEEKVDLSTLEITEVIGEGNIQIVKYENGHWQLFVDGEPFTIKGITYQPTKVGISASDMGRSTSWMHEDANGNGKCDAAYDAWVDENSNNKKDQGEKSVGDFKLLKDMGVNAIRLYHDLSDSEYLSEEYDKKVLRDLYNNYGIRVIMGDFLGAYGVGSGMLGVDEGTDYTDKKQKKMMKEIVKNMVLDHKDEPYVLMWILGNENDFPAESGGVNATMTNAPEYPEEYVEFVNEVAEMIHKIDPNHPVAVGNFGTDLIEYFDNYAPAVDIYGINAYRGIDGFGSLWRVIQSNYNRPVLITEYGCDAYHHEKGENPKAQAAYHKGNWRDIAYNFAGEGGTGIAIGGIVFEWMDEWWKDTFGDSSFSQQIAPQAAMPFFDGWGHEEWFGIIGQGSGKNSPFQRNLRESYFMYKDLWNE